MEFQGAEPAVVRAGYRNGHIALERNKLLGVCTKFF